MQLHMYMNQSTLHRWIQMNKWTGVLSYDGEMRFLI